MNVEDLELFIHIADLNSISAAAQRRNLSVATASAALKRLEKQLGCALFMRSPRRLAITKEGEQFLLSARHAMATLSEGVTQVQSMQGQVAGHLRISVPSDLGRSILMPWIDGFQDQHPGLIIQMIVGDRLTDLVRDRIDIAIRYVEPEDSSMVAFHLARVDRVVCAAPTYLRDHDPIVSPIDLRDHNCLIYKAQNDLFNHWVFEKDGQKEKVTVSGNRISDDGEIVRRWAIAGKGVTNKPVVDVYDDLKAGRLIAILGEYQTIERNIWLYCPNREQVTPAVFLLRDLLREKLSSAYGV